MRLVKRTNQLKLLKHVNKLSVDTQVDSKVEVQQMVPVRDPELLMAIVGVLLMHISFLKEITYLPSLTRHKSCY
jgi:hypothetical protein